MEVQPGPREIGAQRQREKRSVDSFARDIEAALPNLRRYAHYLTHDAANADDLVQETIAHGIEKIHLWREGTDLRSWLSTILHNLHASGIRQASRRRAAFARTSAQLPLACLPHQIACLELRDLQRALARLPQGQRSVVMLVGWDGGPYETIAARLGIPVGTVRSRLSRGRSRLRELTDSAPLPAKPKAFRPFH